MNKREAQKLAKRIEGDDPLCRVTGLWHWHHGRWGIDVTDTRTGYPFVVGSEYDWEMRRRAAELDMAAAFEEAS